MWLAGFIILLFRWPCTCWWQSDWLTCLRFIRLSFDWKDDPTLSPSALSSHTIPDEESSFPSLLHISVPVPQASFSIFLTDAKVLVMSRSTSAHDLKERVRYKQIRTKWLRDRRNDELTCRVQEMIWKKDIIFDSYLATNNINANTTFIAGHSPIAQLYLSPNPMLSITPLLHPNEGPFLSLHYTFLSESPL